MQLRPESKAVHRHAHWNSAIVCQTMPMQIVCNSCRYVTNRRAKVLRRLFHSHSCSHPTFCVKFINSSLASVVFASYLLVFCLYSFGNIGFHYCVTDCFLRICWFYRMRSVFLVLAMLQYTIITFALDFSRVNEHRDCIGKNATWIANSLCSSRDNKGISIRAVLFLMILCPFFITAITFYAMFCARLLPFCPKIADKMSIIEYGLL